MAILYFDRDSKDVTQGMDARSFVEMLQQRDNFESGEPERLQFHFLILTRAAASPASAQRLHHGRADFCPPPGTGFSSWEEREHRQGLEAFGRASFVHSFAIQDIIKIVGKRPPFVLVFFLVL
eukprot:263214-Hanusia_phi.AAC.9